MQFTTQDMVQLLLAYFYKNGLEMYVSTNKQLIYFENYFGVLSGLSMWESSQKHNLRQNRYCILKLE
jgi:hypothetical protein